MANARTNHSGAPLFNFRPLEERFDELMEGATCGFCVGQCAVVVLWHTAVFINIAVGELNVQVPRGGFVAHTRDMRRIYLRPVHLFFGLVQRSALRAFPVGFLFLE